MYEDLSGKVAIVTGGSKGIGKAIVKRFVNENSIVISLSRHIPEDRIDGAFYMKTDVSKLSDVKSAINEVIGRYKTVDILINNAGIEEYSNLSSTDENMWDNIMNINVKGIYNTSRECIPLMMNNHRGNIVNMSSVQAQIITKNAAAYVTSKHAVIGLTKSIALDYAPYIRCNAVLPATIDTPLVDKAAMLEVGNNTELINKKKLEWGKEHPLGRIGRVDEVANAVAFLASDESSFITGASLFVDGGLSIKAPISTPEE